MSSKFSSEQAETLWEYSLSGLQDDELGEADTFGWFALFEEERAILSTGSQGFVHAAFYDSADEMSLAWTELQMRHARWEMDSIDTSECDGLFLLIDTARHGGWIVTQDEVADHVAECGTCVEEL